MAKQKRGFVAKGGFGVGSHWISAVICDGIRSEVNQIHFHLTFRAEWFHPTKTEWIDTGLPQRRVTAPPNLMRKAIWYVINLVSRNWGFERDQWYSSLLLQCDNLEKVRNYNETKKMLVKFILY